MNEFIRVEEFLSFLKIELQENNELYERIENYIYTHKVKGEDKK